MPCLLACTPHLVLLQGIAGGKLFGPKFESNLSWLGVLTLPGFWGGSEAGLKGPACGTVAGAGALVMPTEGLRCRQGTCCAAETTRAIHHHQQQGYVGYVDSDCSACLQGSLLVSLYSKLRSLKLNLHALSPNPKPKPDTLNPNL